MYVVCCIPSQPMGRLNYHSGLPRSRAVHICPMSRATSLLPRCCTATASATLEWVTIRSIKNYSWDQFVFHYTGLLLKYKRFTVTYTYTEITYKNMNTKNENSSIEPRLIEMYQCKIPFIGISSLNAVFSAVLFQQHRHRHAQDHVFGFSSQ
jgi:hypothetical protein